MIYLRVHIYSDIFYYLFSSLTKQSQTKTGLYLCINQMLCCLTRSCSIIRNRQSFEGANVKRKLSISMCMESKRTKVFKNFNSRIPEEAVTYSSSFSTTTTVVGQDLPVLLVGLTLRYLSIAG